MNRILNVYLQNNYAGDLIQDDSGRLDFRYDPAYLKQQRPAISLSLPTQREPHYGKHVSAFTSP